jgi:hypothetical protein
MVVGSDRLQLGNSNTTNPPMSRVNSYGVPSRGMGTAKRLPGSEPVYAPHNLVETYQDNREPEKVAKLYEEMVGFENLADDPYVVEQAKAAIQSSLKDVFATMQYLRNKWLIMYRLYRGETINQYSYGRMKLHSPTPFKIVESMHPRIMRTLFGNEAWFKLYGENEEHDAASKAQEALCRDQHRAMNYKQKVSRLIRDGLIYGTSVQKTYWKQEMAERAYRTARRVPHPKIPGASKIELEETRRKELMFDGNDVMPISIFDFQASPAASSIDEAEWCLDRSMWPDFRVKQMIELGHWLQMPQLATYGGSNDFSYEDPFKQRKAYSYGVFDSRNGAQAPHIPHYEVVDWWGPLVIKEKNGDYTTRICNGVMIDPRGLAIIPRITINPFWHGKKPYQVWRPIELEGELFGIGAIEMIARLSVEKDTKRQLLMAATQLEANPMFVVSDQANIPAGQLLAQPGLVIRVPDPQNAVVPLQFAKVSDSALKAENVLEAEMREVSGVTAPVIGTQDPMGGGDKTATQSNNDLNEANMRLSGAIANFDMSITVPMLEQMAWNNMQFQSYEKVVRDIGAMGINFRDRFTIRPEDLIGRFIVQPLSGFRLLTKQTQVQQLVNLLDRAPVINQMYGPTAVNMPRLLAYILETGFDIRNADEFIKLPAESDRLLSAIEEQELWYHGNVPPRRPDDNDAVHWQVHMKEMGADRFQLLMESDPQTAALARAHIADHVRALAKLFETQNQFIMQMQQQATALGVQAYDAASMAGAVNEPMKPGGDSQPQPPQGQGIEGAASPGQKPGSPLIRPNETARQQPGPFAAAKSPAMASAPNPGAS